MVTMDFSGEDGYKVLVNVGGFRHVRTTGDHLILRWEPPDNHENTDVRVVTVPAHDSISIGTLHDIADDAGAADFEAFCEWIDEHR
jgi:predicted RNA binding protein YcfA (HicA-like mRNA interferase family)